MQEYVVILLPDDIYQVFNNQLWWNHIFKELDKNSLGNELLT